MRRKLLNDNPSLRAALVALCWLVGLSISALPVQPDSSSSDTVPLASAVTAAATPAVLGVHSSTDLDRDKSLELLAAADPMGFLEAVLNRYEQSVQDYTCIFSKQERIEGKLGREQVMRVFFRESPFSVRLHFLEDADRCKSVLYVEDRWAKNSKRMAVVEPTGIARWFVSHVMRDINGKDAKKSSRRRIDQFGFRNAMLLTLKYCHLADQHNALDLRFTGTRDIAGRCTLVFERRLPYSSKHGAWPDRLLVVHIDRELLVPTLCEAYADDDKKILLGRYAYREIVLNAGLDESVFTKSAMGL